MVDEVETDQRMIDIRLFEWEELLPRPTTKIGNSPKKRKDTFDAIVHEHEPNFINYWLGSFHRFELL